MNRKWEKALNANPKGHWECDECDNINRKGKTFCRVCKKGKK
jgi:hypothetical protein